MKVREILKSRPAVMGILNVTPDSFSDGGKYFSPESALRRALEMKESGAAVIDVGGESTRPGAAPVSAGEEMSRVIPVIEALASDRDVRVSCDTSKFEVARVALGAGAVMINDVTGFTDPRMRRLAAEKGAAVCIMHMAGTPQTMQNAPSYGSVLDEVRDFLHRQGELCEADGVSPENIIVDPGIGFGKTLEHNLSIMANIDLFSEKYPVMAGASRKSFIGMLTGAGTDGRLSGSVAAACWLALEGADMIRAHDVKETLQALKIIEEIKKRKK